MPKKDIKIPTVEEMLQAGVHFGHQVKRQVPIMRKYVYDVDQKAHVIDVYQTQEMLKTAAEFLYDVAREGKQIIIVGTKRQSSQIVEKLAKKSGAMYVNQRWLGGTFTNFKFIKGKTDELKRLIEGMSKNEFSYYTKKERLLIDRKIEKLETFVGGIRDIAKWPGAMIVVDVKKEHVAVSEANKVEVPVVAIVDTNSDPKNIDYVIPANDDAIKSIELLLGVLASAIELGYKEFGDAPKKSESGELDNEGNVAANIDPEEIIVVPVKEDTKLKKPKPLKNESDVDTKRTKVKPREKAKVKVKAKIKK